MKFLLCRKSERLFVWNVNSFKWQNSLRFSASSTGQQHWLRERGRHVTLRSETDLMLLSLSLSLAFSYLNLRIFANEAETGLHCNVPVLQFCIHRSTCRPAAVCSISRIPAEETTFRILPVCFQEDAGLTLILRDKYLFGAILFIYPSLFFFLDQWEQTTSSFPYWEMMVGLFSKFSV